MPPDEASWSFANVMRLVRPVMNLDEAHYFVIGQSEETGARLAVIRTRTCLVARPTLSTAVGTTLISKVGHTDSAEISQSTGRGTVT